MRARPLDRCCRLAGIRVGCQIVTGECARQLIGSDLLEIARCREVPRLAVALGQRVVRDLANEGLHKDVLAALR